IGIQGADGPAGGGGPDGGAGGLRVAREVSSVAQEVTSKVRTCLRRGSQAAGGRAGTQAARRGRQAGGRSGRGERTGGRGSVRAILGCGLLVVLSPAAVPAGVRLEGDPKPP